MRNPNPRARAGGARHVASGWLPLRRHVLAALALDCSSRSPWGSPRSMLARHCRPRARPAARSAHSGWGPTTPRTVSFSARTLASIAAAPPRRPPRLQKYLRRTLLTLFGIGVAYVVDRELHASAINRNIRTAWTVSTSSALCSVWSLSCPISHFRGALLAHLLCPRGICPRPLRLLVSSQTASPKFRMSPSSARTRARSQQVFFSPVTRLSVDENLFIRPDVHLYCGPAGLTATDSRNTAGT